MSHYYPPVPRERLAAKNRDRELKAAERARLQPGRERWKRLYQDAKIKRNRIVRRKR